MCHAERVPVLMYHRVGTIHDASEARYAISPANFAAHMQTLASAGYRAVDIDALVAWLEGGASLPKGAFVLTFDDGYRGVRDHAQPVLEDLGWPFTIFLVSDLIGGEDDWARLSETSGLRYPLLDTTDILDMHKRGCSFHSHTRSHTSLPALDDSLLADELAGSRKALFGLLADEVNYIAYPYGHLDNRVEAAARAAGYRAGFSVQPGFNRRDINRFRIRRLDIFGTDTPRMLLRKLRFGCNDGSLANVVRYYLDRLSYRLGKNRR